VRRGLKLADTPRIWKIGGLEVDEYAHTVKREDTVIALTAKERQILVLLVRNANRVVSRETLAHDVWPDMNRATPLDNVIDVHLANLRRKLEDGQTGRLIQTIRGVGFLFRSPQS
jgi:DNA-binding response OmpR family regulator